MLGKIIKYEWKSVYKICSVLVLTMLVMTILGCLSFHTPLWVNGFQDSFNGSNLLTPMDVLGFIFLIFYFITLFVVVNGILIYLAVHFYKTMYTEQGYLTHTLPVTSNQLLVGKVLVAAIWYGIVCIVMLGSVVSLVLSFIDVIAKATGEFANVWEAFYSFMPYITEMLNEVVGKGVWMYLVYLFVLFFVSIFTTFITIFAAITIGQLSAKHKVMMSIISFVAIQFIMQIISTIVMIPLTLAQWTSTVSSVTTDSILFPLYSNIGTILIQIVFACVLYFASKYIIEKKLNLE